jgi:nitrite reductase/ring-hydroxylating ferredoxin subunit/uncharacterized membrane protein
MIDPRTLGERLEAAESLDRFAGPAHRAVTRLLPSGPAKDVLHGVWLGHPLHPLLTDLPIGFWTSAFVLDLVGGRRAPPAADVLVGLGVAAAVPTAAAGVADWSELNTPERRSGAVHAVANLAATTLYTLSLIARTRGKRGRGVALAMAGATAATVGGFLGGHLTFRRAAGVNQAAGVSTDTAWADITIEGTLGNDKPVLAHLDDTPLAAIETDGSPTALFDTCNHLGGPLHEGDVVDGCLRCPWHGSTFRATDGTVVRGPATAPQPAFEVRVDGDKPQARRRPPA